MGKKPPKQQSTQVKQVGAWKYNVGDVIGDSTVVQQALIGEGYPCYFIERKGKRLWVREENL